MKKRKVFIVDDHPVVREGLLEYINSEKDLVVCGEAESSTGVLERINLSKPDIMILDIILNGANGIDLLKEINKNNNIPVLILSMHDEKIYAERALRAGARGYITKNESMTKVIDAIKKILDGDIFIDSKFKDKLLNKFLFSPDPGVESTVDNLTNRELEVFQYIGQGIGTRDISEKMSLKIKTIETYRERIKKKLNLKNGSELIQYAVLWNYNTILKR